MLKRKRVRGKWAGLNAAYISSLIGMKATTCREHLRKKFTPTELSTKELGIFIANKIMELEVKGIRKDLNEVRKFI